MNRWEKINNNYIKKDIKIIPIQPNSKVPLISNWDKDCSSDYMQILYWYENNHNMNFAIPCFENNLFVIDLDRHDKNKDGVSNFIKLIKYLDININSLEDIGTLIQKTPSGGLHIIFKSDNDLSKVKGLANAFPNYPGIDLRNKNYIVSEPSIIDGNKYEFINNNNIQKMPNKLKEYILSNIETTDSKREPYKKPTNVEVGDRDNQLFSYINNIYYKTSLDYDEILCLANNFNENILEKPFSERVVKYKIDKVFNKSRNKYIFINLGDNNE